MFISMNVHLISFSILIIYSDVRDVYLLLEIFRYVFPGFDSCLRMFVIFIYGPRIFVMYFQDLI